MKQNMKKRLSIIITLGLLFSICLGACSNKSKDSLSVDKKEITLDFWTIDLKATFNEFFEEMIAKYEEQNPNIKIKWTDLPYADIQSKLITSVAGGTAPDIVNLNTQMALTLAGEKAVVDLNKEAKKEQIEIYIPSLWQSASIGDSAYAFPWYASPSIKFYNEELFEKAGIAVPKTYNEALENAEEFYEKTGAYLFQPAEFFYLLFQENIDVLDENRTKAAFNNDETIKLLEQYKELTDKGVLPKENWGNWAAALKSYEMGELAIINASGASLTRIKDEAPDVYEKTNIEEPITGKLGLSHNSLMNLVVPSTGKNIPDAIKFANYVTNDANQLAFCKKTAIFPSTIKASEDSFFTSDLDSKEGLASAMSAKASKNSEDFSLKIANQNNIQIAINKIYQAVIINGEDIKESLKIGEEDVNKILSKN